MIPLSQSLSEGNKLLIHSLYSSVWFCTYACTHGARVGTAHLRNSGIEKHASDLLLEVIRYPRTWHRSDTANPRKWASGSHSVVQSTRENSDTGTRRPDPRIDRLVHRVNQHIHWFPFHNRDRYSLSVDVIGNSNIIISSIIITHIQKQDHRTDQVEIMCPKLEMQNWKL